MEVKSTQVMNDIDNTEAKNTFIKEKVSAQTLAYLKMFARTYHPVSLFPFAIKSGLTN